MKLDKAIDEIAKRGTRAWGELKKTKDFNHWWTVGEALQALQQEAMNEAGIPLQSNSRPAGIVFSRAMGDLLKKYKLDDMDKGDRSRLLSMMAYRKEITEWHTGLSPVLRTRYTHPTTVWRHWQASIAPPQPQREPKMTNLKQTEEALIDAHEENHRLKAYVAELEAARENGSAQLSFDELSDAFVSGLKDRPREEKAQTLYAMLLQLDLSLSHLDAAAADWAKKETDNAKADAKTKRARA
jgi:hypothetical protein